MAYAAAAVLAGAAAQSATGFGFALVSGPVLFAVFEPEEAVTMLAALGLVLSVLVLADGKGQAAWRPLAPLLLAAIPGLGIGLLALAAFSKPVLQVAVGLAVVAAAVFQIRSGRAREGEAKPGPLAGGLVGLVSGALTTSLGVNGPPVALWLEARGSNPGEMRATLAACFLALNLCGFAVLVAAHGPGDVAGPGRLLPLAAAVVAGHVAGAMAFRRLDPGTFRIAVLALVIAAGVASAVAGAASL